MNPLLSWLHHPDNAWWLTQLPPVSLEHLWDSLLTVWVLTAKEGKAMKKIDWTSYFAVAPVFLGGVN